MNLDDTGRRKQLIIGAAVVAVALLLIAVVTTGGRPIADLGIFGDSERAGGETDSGSSLDSENVTLATDADSDSDSHGDAQDSGADSDSGDGDSDSGNGSGEDGSGTGGDSNDPADPDDPDATMRVMILFWNDTQSTAPDSTEIVLAGQSWTPNTDGESDAGSASDLPFGQEILLEIYPDGRDGSRLTVPVTFTSEMVSDSEQDAIHVEISDDKVRVLGNAVSNFDVALDRF